MITPPTVASWTQGAIADLFSSYVASGALSAAHEIGLLDSLQTNGWVDIATIYEDGRHADRHSVATLCASLAWAGVVDIEGSTVRPGPRFADAYAARGYFYWLIRGCGNLFTTAPELLWEDHRGHEHYTRDMHAVALGSRLIGDVEVEPLFDETLAPREFSVIADLGCGSGQRLMRIARRHPHVRGIGIDIATAAVNLATESVQRAGLASRITIHRDDVLRLRSQPEYADVDIVSCVFMGHDFWPMESCVRTLRGLRAAFPKAATLLLCDVTRSSTSPGPGTPIFTLGFELAHALMDTYVPTRAEWDAAFAEGGWELRSAITTTAPPGGVLFDLSPARDVP
jgi:phenylpyruvate C(3)-methyltransferase